VAKTKFGLKGKARDAYLELVLAFPLCSIQSDEHLDEAQQVMDRLLAKGKIDDGEEMYLDALSDLVAVYEDKHHAIEPASDAEILRHLVEAKGVTQSQLSQEAGIAKSTISEILAGLRWKEAVQPSDDSEAIRVLRGRCEHPGVQLVNRVASYVGLSKSKSANKSAMGLVKPGSTSPPSRVSSEVSTRTSLGEV
jgi:HTH-type transcriptional regulator / antitoxin HigA